MGIPASGVGIQVRSFIGWALNFGIECLAGTGQSVRCFAQLTLLLDYLDKRLFCTVDSPASCHAWRFRHSSVQEARLEVQGFRTSLLASCKARGWFSV